jgi:hypothetical protein
VSDGRHKIIAVAEDQLLNKAQDEIWVTVDNGKPNLWYEVTSPTLQFAPVYIPDEDVWEVYEQAVNVTAIASDDVTYAYKLWFDRTDSQGERQIAYHENGPEDPDPKLVVTETVEYLLDAEITTIAITVEDAAGNSSDVTVRIRSLYAVADKVVGEAIVGPDGGIVDAYDGTMIDIPAGAVNKDTLISIRLVPPIQIPMLNDDDLPTCVQGTHFARRFEPEDLVFLKWVTITMVYHEGEIIRRFGSTDAEKELAIFAWDGMRWNRVSKDADVDTTNNTITARVNHLGLFRIMRDCRPKPSEFDVYLTCNPFSPNGDGDRDHTVFIYELPYGGLVTIKVYDLAGDLVKVLAENEDQDRGYHEAMWTGESDFANYVGSGLYVFKFSVKYTEGEYKDSLKIRIKPVGVIK